MKAFLTLGQLKQHLKTQIHPKEEEDEGKGWKKGEEEEEEIRIN